MTDTIFVKGLVLHAYHGLLPHEAAVGQRFVIDIELTLDLAAASRSDRLGDTVSYVDVVAKAGAAFCAEPRKLIEAAAGAICDALLKEFPTVGEVRVVIHKPHAPISAIFDDVGVSLLRRRGTA
jgi:dihydroneopterin aldolase